MCRRMRDHAPTLKKSMNTTLRSYPANSGPAAARIVALAMIADGQMKTVETATLETLQASERLALTKSQWHEVIDDLCADLIAPARGDGEVVITPDSLNQALDEVTDAALRLQVLHLCAAVAQADRSIHAAESFVLLAAIDRWELSPDEAALVDPLRRSETSRSSGRVSHRV